MIVGVERRGGNLHAYGRRETKSAANAHSSKSESRCEENLLSTGVRSGFVKRGVHFQFRPELPIRLILEGGVQLKLLAELGCAACREVETNRGLNVEPSPTFSEGQCWREHRVACSVAMRARGRRGAENKREQIVAFAAFRRRNPDLQRASVR